LLLAALIAYQPLAVLLGLVGLVTGLHNKNRLDQFLALWWLLALVLALVYPARRVTDLSWPLIPLWALASRQIVRLFNLKTDEMSLAAVAQGLLAVVLLGFAWMNLAGMANPALSTERSMRMVAILGAIFLLIPTSFLMGYGWSWSAMRVGLTLGIGACLVVYSISAVWHAAGLGNNPTLELYQTSQPVQDEDLLVKTIQELATWHNGNASIIDIVVTGFQSPALNWALRGFSQVDLLEALPPTAQPSIVITQTKDTLSAADSYRGQDFVWNQPVDWIAMTPIEWFTWLTVRTAPYQRSPLMLWARNDLFYGGAPVVPNPAAQQ
jgi:hypothetical protein